MARKWSVFVVTLLAMALLATSAGAITYGEPDGTGHPNVGAVIAEWRTPGVKEQLCSGTLISPTVFLTAAHCTAYLESIGIPRNRIWVSFDQDVDPLTAKTKLYPGTWTTNPDYNQRQADPADLAIIKFARPLPPTPANLPRQGLFDEMQANGSLRDQQFTAVGYGVHEPEVGPGGPTWPYDGERWRAVSSFNALTPAWLRLSQNDATHDGGTCYGDSGGPNFLGAGIGETNIVASVTVTGDAMCRATNVTYRLDTPSARTFLGEFVTLP